MIIQQNGWKTIFLALPYPINEYCYVFNDPSSDLVANYSDLVFFVHSTGSADCLTILLKKGALVNVQDKIGVTPLHLASRNG